LILKDFLEDNLAKFSKSLILNDNLDNLAELCKSLILKVKQFGVGTFRLKGQNGLNIKLAGKIKADINIRFIRINKSFAKTLAIAFLIRRYDHKNKH